MAKILIDCTPQIEIQLKRERIDPNSISAILITHAHQDAVGGLPKLDKLLTKKIILFAPPRVLQHKRLQKKFKHITLAQILPHQETSIYGLKVTPFRVIHAEAFPTGKDFPCYGYRFDRVVYAEDMEDLPKNSEQYFKDVKTMIIDASLWFGKKIRGHMNVKQALDFAKRFNAETIILTQAGRTYPSYNKAVKEIEKYWKEIKGKGEVLLAYDGMIYMASIA
ncbi:MAG: MBL fold metallo-hydrolase [Candidatus Heimdallarchaeota archaeon]